METGNSCLFHQALTLLKSRKESFAVGRTWDKKNLF